jgi:hypothetical protein
VFGLETERSISNDWVRAMKTATFNWSGRWTIRRGKAKVMVCEWEDGRIEIRYLGKARPCWEIEAPQPKVRPIRLAEKPSNRAGNHRPAIPGVCPGRQWRRCGEPPPQLHPNRSAYGLGRLRSGSGPPHGKELVAKEKRGQI